MVPRFRIYNFSLGFEGFEILVDWTDSILLWNLWV